MNSDIFLARQLLQDINKLGKDYSVITFDNGEFVDSKYHKEIIDNLQIDGLLIHLETNKINDILLKTYRVTELGNLVSSFIDLNSHYGEFRLDQELILRGDIIHLALKKYDENEIDKLLKYLTPDEQESYSQYFIYRTKKKKEEAIPAFNPELSSMFEMSVKLGERNSSPRRTNSYVLQKCMEELGELSVEDQIDDGLSYKVAGPDGVKGEAVDLAICAMDMFALQCPDKTAEEIEKEFLEYMAKKLTKWNNSIR